MRICFRTKNPSKINPIRAKNQKKIILSLNDSEAKIFFFKNESYVNFDLPIYIKFDILLSKISDNIKDEDYWKIRKSNPNDFENVNYKLLHNKNGKYDWRPFQLIHPVLYVSLVNQMTTIENWEFIKNRFEEIKKSSFVKCVSMPILSETKKSDKAEQILNWWEEIEQESLKLSLEFNYLYHTDITDCYGSMYTHSIVWAMHGKEYAKNHKKIIPENIKLIGNIIDRHLQAMSYGQTNGIPQGSVLMDFIAEIVLHYIDSELTKSIKNDDTIKDIDFKILRYRDDYRIFVNNPTIADKIIKYLTEALIDVGLKLHSQKTTSYDNVINGSIKSDKIDWMMCKRNATTIQKRLLILHRFSDKNKNSGTLIKELTNIFKLINQKMKDEKSLYYENIDVLISIVTDIAYHNPKTYSISIAILSLLFSLLNEKDGEVEQVIKKVIKKFSNIPNTGHMELWLQRAIIKSDIDMSIFNENICKLVNGTQLSLWNNDWLHDASKTKKNITNILEETSIIDKAEIERIDSIVDNNEVVLFRVQNS